MQSGSRREVFPAPQQTTGTGLYFRDGASIVDGSGNKVGSWIPDQQRVQYDWRNIDVDAAIMKAAKSEGALWDEWAGSETGRNTPETIRQKSFAIWRQRYPVIDLAIGESGIDINLENARILDIGGSGKDAAYWVSENPQRIDQIEVSPQSQAMCLARIRDYEAAYGGDVADRLFFHTLPAEQLPFADNTFDFVFSRATIHHCRRPAAIDEAVRVLKPGGTLMFVERYLSRPMYAAMSTYRTLRKVDRGSDDPLRPDEAAYAGTLLSRYWWTPMGCMEPFHYFLRRTGLATKEKDGTELPSRFRFLEHMLGTSFICIGRK